MLTEFLVFGSLACYVAIFAVVSLAFLRMIFKE